MVDVNELYEIERGIGRGAFGTVFCARERASDRLVALKVVELDAADDEIEDMQVVLFLFVLFPCVCF